MSLGSGPEGRRGEGGGSEEKEPRKEHSLPPPPTPDHTAWTHALPPPPPPPRPAEALPSRSLPLPGRFEKAARPRGNPAVSGPEGALQPSQEPSALRQRSNSKHGAPRSTRQEEPSTRGGGTTSPPWRGAKGRPRGLRGSVYPRRGLRPPPRGSVDASAIVLVLGGWRRGQGAAEGLGGRAGAVWRTEALTAAPSPFPASDIGIQVCAGPGPGLGSGGLPSSSPPWRPEGHATRDTGLSPRRPGHSPLPNTLQLQEPRDPAGEGQGASEPPRNPSAPFSLGPSLEGRPSQALPTWPGWRESPGRGGPTEEEAARGARAGGGCGALRAGGRARPRAQAAPPAPTPLDEDTRPPPPEAFPARRRARLRPGLGLQASQGHSGPRRPLGRSSPRLTHRTTRHRTPDGMPEPCPISELRLSHPGPQAPRHHGPKGESLGTSLAFAQTNCHHDLNPERWPGSEGQRGPAGALAPPGGHALEQHVSALPLLPTGDACSALAPGPLPAGGSSSSPSQQQDIHDGRGRDPLVVGQEPHPTHPRTAATPFVRS